MVDCYETAFYLSHKVRCFLYTYVSVHHHRHLSPSIIKSRHVVWKIMIYYGLYKSSVWMGYAREHSLPPIFKSSSASKPLGSPDGTLAPGLDHAREQGIGWR